MLQNFVFEKRILQRYFQFQYIYMYFERVMKYPGVAFNLCVISVTGGKQEFCLQFNQLHRVCIRPVPDKFITILARSDTRSDTRNPWRRNCIRRRFVLYIHRASQKSLATNFRITTCCSIFNLFCNSINMKLRTARCKHTLTHGSRSSIFSLTIISIIKLLRKLSRIKAKWPYNKIPQSLIRRM